MHRLDCLASHGDLSLYNLARERLQSTSEEHLRPKPLLTGNDLIAAGYQPGAEFKEMLAAVENAQLEGTIKSREEALAVVQKRFGKHLG
jgi:tRNA nucleotidyltransferase/poly(A) polymerase